MNKRGLALSSLVMAIPAGYLAYISVRSVFEMNESMPTAVTVIVWTLIVISGLIALSPFIFLVAGPSGAAAAPFKSVAGPAPAQGSKKPSPKKAAEEDDEFAESDEALEEDDGQLFDASDEEAGAEEYEDQFNFDDDDIEDAFDDEEEEPAPKKKKR
jgi:hypothetical protein